MRAHEILNEVKIDNSKGWGAVPYNADISYFGLRVLMCPSVFLKLATKLNETPSTDIESHIASGGEIGSPFLEVTLPIEWEDNDFSNYAKISGHEGRNRMHAIMKVEGDDPVEVHIIPRGGMRRRHITDDMITRLNQGAYSEKSSNLIHGPLFKLIE